MTTVAQQAELVRRRLFGGALGRYNFLSAPLDANQTTVHLTGDTQGVVQGARLGVDDEIMLCRTAPDTTAMTVEVLRGFLGTTQAAHSDGALVELNPRFARGDIVDTMREEIESWGESLFRVSTHAFLANEGTRAYDLVGAVKPYFLLELTRNVSTTLSTNDNARSYVPAELLRDQDVTVFASGFAVQTKARIASGSPMVVSWAEPFTTGTWTESTDLITDCGMTRSLLDIITYGTVWRLLATREVGRTDLQAGGDQRRAEEVPPLYQARLADAVLKLRDRRFADESLALRGRYPYRWA